MVPPPAQNPEQNQSLCFQFSYVLQQRKKRRDLLGRKLRTVVMSGLLSNPFQRTINLIATRLMEGESTKSCHFDRLVHVISRLHSFFYPCLPVMEITCLVWSTTRIWICWRGRFLEGCFCLINNVNRNRQKKCIRSQQYYTGLTPE